MVLGALLGGQGTRARAQPAQGLCDPRHYFATIHAAADDAFDLDELCSTDFDPASFYLRSEGLQYSPDAFVLVGSKELPCHTTILCRHSPVFESAYLLAFRRAKKLDCQQEVDEIQADWGPAVEAGRLASPQEDNPPAPDTPAYMSRDPDERGEQGFPLFSRTISGPLCEAKKKQGVQAACAQGTRTQLYCLARLEGFSVKDVALFLRLLYHPRDVNPATLTKLQAHLPSLARLAHKYSTKGLLTAIDRHLSHQQASASLPQLISSLQLAETLQMDGLRAAGAAALAHSLAAPSPGGDIVLPLDAGFLEAAQLGSLSAGTLRLLLGALAAAIKAGAGAGAGGGGRGGAAGALASLLRQDTLHSWVGLRGHHGEYAWAIPNYPAARGRLASPGFEVGRRAWRVAVDAAGMEEGEGGWFSVHLELAEAEQQLPGGLQLKAAARFTLLSCNRGGSVVGCMPPACFSGERDAWGIARFYPIAQVADPSRGLLVGGTLTCKVEVVW